MTDTVDEARVRRRTVAVRDSASARSLFRTCTAHLPKTNRVNDIDLALELDADAKFTVFAHTANDVLGVLVAARRATYPAALLVAIPPTSDDSKSRRVTFTALLRAFEKWAAPTPRMLLCVETDMSIAAMAKNAGYTTSRLKAKEGCALYFPAALLEKTCNGATYPVDITDDEDEDEIFDASEPWCTVQ